MWLPCKLRGTDRREVVLMIFYILYKIHFDFDFLKQNFGLSLVSWKQGIFSLRSVSEDEFPHYVNLFRQEGVNIHKLKRFLFHYTN